MTTISSESLMIDPIRRALENIHPPSVWAEQYRSGYGIADLVGMVISQRARQLRADNDVKISVSSRRGLAVLAVLQQERSVSLDSLARRTALTDNTVRAVLRILIRSGLAVGAGNRAYRLSACALNPASEIIAVEAKIDRWSRAILQARRYLLFADRTYVAISAGTVSRVDRAFLYRHRVGLIGVGNGEAYVVVPAPRVRPRSSLAHRACAERLFSISA